MALYQLPLPPLNLLPISIPEHIHPLFVHFAIALPIVILLIELFNLIAKRRSIAIMSLMFMVLLAIVIFGAIATGITDAKLATLSDEAKSVVLEHKAISTYLLYGVGVLIILKLLSLFVSKNLFKFAYVIFTLIFIATTFYEGKLGGSLVYKYGVNVGTKSKTEAPKAPKTTATESKKEESVNKEKQQENTSEANKSQEVAPQNNETSSQEENKTQNSDEANTNEENKTQSTPVETTQDNSSKEKVKEENSTQTDEANATKESNETK